MKETSDYLTRLKKTSLFKKLKTRESKKGVLEVFELSRAMLKKCDEIFFHFTSHDIGHAVRTLESFCAIVEHIGILNELTEEEATISVCSCLLHDVGMGPLNTIEIGAATTQGISLETKESWRANHHERVMSWLMESGNATFDFMTPKTLESVAQVARAHRKVNLLSEESMISNARLAFLAALLRLADQMDLSPARVEERLVNRKVIRHLLENAQNPQQEKQIREFLKNFAEKEWYLKLDQEGNRIVLHSKIELDDLTLLTLDALEELAFDIELTIEQTKNVSFETRFPLPRKLEFSFSVADEASHKHKLQADFRRVWEYLNVYLYPKGQHHSIALREAVTNAIDACRIQQAIEPDQDYSVTVRYEEDRIVIEDNGCGMPLEVIEDHLKVLGSSYYDSPAFRGDPRYDRNIPVIGQFGIGAFSYLLMCDSFEIVTRSASNNAYRILVSKSFGVTTKMDDIEGLERGTVLTIPSPRPPRETRWESAHEVQKLLKQTFLFPPIPVLFEHANKTSEIRLNLPHPTQRITDRNKLVEVELCDHRDLDDCNVGFSMYVQLPRWGFRSDPYGILVLHNDLAERFRRVGDLGGTTIAAYEGLHLREARLAPPPFLNSLNALTQLVNDKRNTFISWVNFHAGSVKLNLPKLSIIGVDFTRRFICRQVVELDKVCKEHSLKILSNPDLSSIHKEAFRYFIIESLVSWGFKHLLRLGNLEDIIRLILAPVVCIDARRLKYTTVGALLRKPHNSKVILLERMRFFVYHMDDSRTVRAILRLKDVVARRDRALSAARQQRNEDLLKEEYADYDLYYVMAGAHPGSDFFPNLMKTIGFTNVVGTEALRSRREI